MQNNHSNPAKFGLGLVAAIATISVSLLFGGAASAPGMAQLVVIGVALISGFGLLARGGMQDVDLPWLVVALLIAVCALPLLQLIPLPPEIWRSLPGRAAETAIIDLAGGGNLSRPLALNPSVNLQLFASLVALIFFALTVARLSATNVNRLMQVILGIALVQFLIGAVQFTTAGASLDFFGNTHKGWLLGTFANRNHAGLFFASCILITVGLSKRLHTKGRTSPVALERVILFSIMLLWLLAAMGTGSRGGFVLALLAMAIGTVISLRAVKIPIWARLGGIGGLAAVMTAVMASGRVQQLADRYNTVGDDIRWPIWNNSITVIQNYFPWGGGFGSFMAVYNKNEPLKDLIPTYVNNAHNDYLELIIEAGLPGAVILAAVFLLVIVAVIRGYRSADSQISRHSLIGGGIILLFAFHSVADYPVRRMATAAILFFAFGLLLRQFGRGQAKA